MQKLILLALFVSSLVLAEGVPFVLSSNSLPPSPDDVHQSALIGRLKYQAVVDYLQRLMGARYARYEGLVTPDFAERYVLDYQVNRLPGRNAIELNGHLDGDALKRWVRVTETKTAGSSSLKPAFLISSSVPGLTILPRETEKAIREMTVGQTVYSMISPVFNKVNAKISPIDDSSVSLTEPPKRDSEMRSLRDFAIGGSRNSVAWVHFSPCKGCGVRVDIILYNLAQSRLVVAKSDNVPFEARDFSNSERLRAMLKEPLHDFSVDFEEAISNGSLFAASHRVVVEGIDTFRGYKQVETAMQGQDYIVGASLKRSEPGLAEFSVLSPLSIKDLAQHFATSAFTGFELKPSRVDRESVTLKYTK